MGGSGSVSLEVAVNLLSLGCRSASKLTPMAIGKPQSLPYRLLIRLLEGPQDAAAGFPQSQLFKREIR